MHDSSIMQKRQWVGDCEVCRCWIFRRSEGEEQKDGQSTSASNLVFRW